MQAPRAPAERRAARPEGGEFGHAPGDLGSLRLRLHQGPLRFGWRLPGESSDRDIGPAIDATYLADEPTRGFTGTMIGMTCVDSYRRDLVARFAYFDRQQFSELD